MEMREATRKDKEAIVRLCRRSVRRDYVPVYVDDFIREGGMLIAIDGGQVVGMMKYTRCTGGDGWFSAGRTDPSWRRRGVAKALMRMAIGYARSRGAKHVRLWCLRSNKPANAAVKSVGFREVGTFARVKRRVRRRPDPPELMRTRGTKNTWSMTRDSSILKESRGYAAIGVEFVKVGAKVVAEASRAGKMYRYGENLCYFDEDAWGGKWEGVAEFTPLAGDLEVLFAEAERLARNSRMKEVHAFLPLKSRLLREARSHGFKVVDWGKEAVLYERKTA